MKNVLQKIALSFVLAVVFASSLLLSACGQGYVQTAWMHLKIDDTYKVVYNTADMYSAMRHISCYANEEDATSGNDCLLSIRFTARSMGGEEVEVDGEDLKTILIDMSSWCDMFVSIPKTIGTEVNPLYDADKAIYVNGTMLDPSQDDSTTNNVSWTFRNVERVLVIGNPDGHINGEVNIIEYK